MLLRERRADHYRREFAANEPDAPADGAELAIAGFDSFLHYEWPFTRLVAATARLVAVHSRVIADSIGRTVPAAHVEYVRLGHGTALADREAAARGSAARRRLGIPDEAVVFGCFGGLTPEKRLPQILDAFAAIRPSIPSARLLLAGPEAAHYDLVADVRRHRLEDAVTRTGYLESDDELTDAIAASDVTLNLRWPTAREISGPWLRCLAAGRASIVIDLGHTADAPSIDPRTWRSTDHSGAAPVTVAVDILDEDHSLRLAMRRLAGDAALRQALGGAARDYWMREHSQAAMIDDYRRILPLAAAAAAPAPPLPAHLTDDGSGLLERTLGEFGVPIPWSKI